MPAVYPTPLPEAVIRDGARDEVLFTCFNRPLAEYLGRSRRRRTTDQAAEPQKVLLDSIRRFKGLERPVIVLAGIDQLPPDEENAVLYVDLSRARVHLVAVYGQRNVGRRT